MNQSICLLQQQNNVTEHAPHIENPCYYTVSQITSHRQSQCSATLTSYLGLCTASCHPSSVIKLSNRCLTFNYMPIFYGLTFLRTKLVECLLSVFSDCLFNTFAANICRTSPLSSIWGRAMAWRQGRREARCFIRIEILPFNCQERTKIEDGGEKIPR
jgi:hypothetical protein